MDVKEDVKRFLNERKNKKQQTINSLLSSSDIVSQLRIHHQERVSQRAEIRYKHANRFFEKLAKISIILTVLMTF